MWLARYCRERSNLRKLKKAAGVILDIREANDREPTRRDARARRVSYQTQTESATSAWDSGSGLPARPKMTGLVTTDAPARLSPRRGGDGSRGKRLSPAGASRRRRARAP